MIHPDDQFASRSPFTIQTYNYATATPIYIASSSGIASRASLLSTRSLCRPPDPSGALVNAQKRATRSNQARARAFVGNPLSTRELALWGYTRESSFANITRIVLHVSMYIRVCNLNSTADEEAMLSRR